MSRTMNSPAVAALLTWVSLVALPAGAVAATQIYPAKPIRLTVPFAAGGPADYAARVVGPALSKSLGQPIVIENRVGADGAIAAQVVMGAAPDGYTLLFGSASLVPLALLKSPPPFDLRRDFSPVSRIAPATWAMYISPSVPAKSVAEFIAYASANPDKLNYASSTLNDFMAATQFAKGSGTSMTKVTYKGAAQAMPDLIAGQVQVNFSPVSAAGLQYVKAGRLRMLGVFSPQRSPVVPDVPTLAESGVPGTSVPGWLAVFAPATTPKEIVGRLSREIERALLEPEIRTQIGRQSMQAEASTPGALAAMVEQDVRTWAQYIRENGLAPASQ